MSTEDKTWDVESYKKTFTKRAVLQPAIFAKLEDCKWHCRDCAGTGIDSKQYAGGGGIQGLQRGTKSRPGLVIITETATCSDCNETKSCDKWTGEFKKANSASGIPAKLQKKIFEHYLYIDCIEQRVRPAHDLVIDHRFPMERWGDVEDSNPSTMTPEEIEDKFQLLKKDDAGNHNLLKSRACERCISTGIRQSPLGITFFYEGSKNWPSDCPSSGLEAKRGCIGCGWYNFDAWRMALNKALEEKEE
mgnify:FL=1